MLELATIFDAKVLAVAFEALTLSLEGAPDKLDDFEELLATYGIVELQRTGRVALPKLAHPHTDKQSRVRAIKRKGRADANDRERLLLRRRRPDADPRQDRGDHRLRQPGPRPRPQPQGLRRQGADRAARRLAVAGQGGGAGTRGGVDRRGRRTCRRRDDPRPRHGAEGDLRRARRPAHDAGQGAGVRPRVQRPLRADRRPRRRRRDHGRAEGTGPPRAPHVHRGRWRAGADRRRAGRHRTGQGAGAVVRRRHRRDARRRHRDDVPGGDRDRPVRRAGRAVRRARRRSSRPGSRRSSTPATPRRWPTSSASTRSS